MTCLTQKQEKFCLAYIETGNASEAYRRAYDAGQMKPASVNRKAKELFDNGKITARVKELRDAAASASIMTRQEALERLSTLARTGISDLVDFRNVEMGLDAEGNDALQAVWSVKDAALQDPAKLAAIAELSAGRDGIKIKAHSQLQAIQQLAKMEGWESAAKHEHTGPNGGPIQHQDMTDEALKQELERLGFGRGAGQLSAKLADGKQ